MRRWSLGALGLQLIWMASACTGTTTDPDDPCIADPASCETPECTADTDCNEEERCIDEVCEPISVEQDAGQVDCPVGTLDCPCDEGACGEGLLCNSVERCEAEPDCPAGTAGCACLPGDACLPDASGQLMLCASASQVCTLVTGSVDNPGASLGVPSTQCYTPCSASISLAGVAYRHCTSEGLMEGCIGGLSCVSGSCVTAGSTPDSCDADVDCPAHQSCLSGFCLSNCDVDGDCGSDETCASHVCRQSCTTFDDNCPSGYACESDNGQDGHCMPQVLQSVAAPEGAPAPFTLSTQSVQFNNNRISGVVMIGNNSDRAETVVVTKRQHTEVSDAGRLVENDNPLFWMELSAFDVSGAELVAPTAAQAIEVEVLPGETVAIVLDEAFNETLTRWEGLVHVASSRLGEADVFLEYASIPDGQWAGSSYYFLDFPTGTSEGDAAIDDWIATLANGSYSEKLVAARLTQNALLVMWTEFRSNPLFSLDEFQAVLSSTLTESWALATVQGGCQELFAGSTAAECYPFADADSSNDEGLRIFTDTASVRVPTGALEMPFVVRLQSDPAAAADYTLTGRLQTPDALQFPGLPPATLVFGADPATCETNASEACLVPIADFEASSLIGGRYLSDTGCDVAGFEAHQVPWLLPDFTSGTSLDDGVAVRTECRESRFPYDDANVDFGKELNLSLAGANPLPDGRVRRRDIEFLDGFMINQDTIVMLVREHFAANLVSPSGEATDAADFMAYSLIQLSKNGSDLSQESDPYAAGLTPDAVSLDEPVGKVANTCDPVLIDDLLGTPDATGQEAELASRILTGLPNVLSPPAPVTSGDNPGLNELHYLCHATGRIDGGRGIFNTPEACPTGSGVSYFFYTGTADLLEDECNGVPADRCSCVSDDDGECVDVSCDSDAIGSCADLLAAAAEGNDAYVLDVPYQCDTIDAGGGYTGEPDSSRVLCHDDRFDLRTGKLFYDPTQVTDPVLPPLETQINDAFRYKTRFQSRSGSSLGFVPDPCATDPSILPYCYDAEAIERVRTRVSCLVDLFASGGLDPVDDASAYDATESFLVGAFSFYQDSPLDTARDGFERLYSELLIMLGDDALTNSVASRFDLAGSQVAAFEGDLLEPDGIVLSGGAGYEMLLLYRAHQYFQLVLDRFFMLSPSLWQGLQIDQEDKNFVTLDSISTYFNRVILASTKKARASSEIAKRYQSFNRADLARHVIERAYAEAYLESVAIGQFMRRSVIVLDANEVDALRYELSQAQLKYRQALRKMRQDYQDITDEVTFFGDPPDYVPFPSAGRYDVAAPRQMIDRAEEMLAVAKEREDRALESNRAFDVDAAQFQSELARIKQQYESELAELCGTMEGPTGQIYPAINRYADQNAVATAFGNPCGLMGNGTIWDTRAEIETKKFDLRAEIADIRAVFDRIAIEENRVESECAGRVAIADFSYTIGTQRVTLREQMNAAEVAMAEWERELSELDRNAAAATAWAAVADSAVGALSSCGGLEKSACVAAAIIGVGAVAGHTTSAVYQTDAAITQAEANKDIATQEDVINDAEVALDTLDRDSEYATLLAECCLDALAEGGDTDPSTCDNPGPLMVNSQAQVDDHMVDLLRTELEALRAELEIQRTLGRLKGYYNAVERTVALWEETEQHLINVEAARNDPNIRIYANADVLDADKTFELALQAAFRATRMYEYYTATSYAAKEDLFLVRMAGRGENNLENYVLDLTTAFNDFEQVYGSPSLRVHMLSLADDIFQIPLTDEDGTALTSSERTTLFRERLTDPGLIDDNGYIRIPFATSVAMTSPITSIHKVAFLEAELQGSDLGDRVGRLYLTAKGTATIRDLDDELHYSRMDPVTAVINPYFNGVRLFGDDVYQEQRLRDRPFANTLWELGLNLRDEQVNLDINVNSISDVRLYLYYEDFTQL